MYTASMQLVAFYTCGDSLLFLLYCFFFSVRRLEKSCCIPSCFAHLRGVTLGVAQTPGVVSRVASTEGAAAEILCPGLYEDDWKPIDQWRLLISLPK